jgi:hypothetical protein
VSHKQKTFGFRFILPPDYPKAAPYVYLDEKENPQVIMMLDYLDAGNKLEWPYIHGWRQASANFT